jgi:hypothetical protein
VGAQTEKLLGPGDPAEMTEDFFALLWGDLLVELLMGVTAPPPPRALARKARQAAEKFLKLHSRDQSGKRRDPAGNV